MALCVVSLFFSCYGVKEFLFLLREVIVNSGASSGDVGIQYSRHSNIFCLLSELSLSNILEATSWRTNTVFTSFYLKDVHYIFEGVRSLGFWLQQANVSVIVLSMCPLYPRDEAARHR